MLPFLIKIANFVNFSTFSKGKKVVLAIIPLPVPNWASAEEQFIPNYPPQITIYSKFFFENPNFSLSIKLLSLSPKYNHCQGIKRKVGAGEIGI